MKAFQAIFVFVCSVAFASARSVVVTDIELMGNDVELLGHVNEHHQTAVGSVGHAHLIDDFKEFQEIFPTAEVEAWFDKSFSSGGILQQIVEVNDLPETRDANKALDEWISRCPQIYEFFDYLESEGVPMYALLNRARSKMNMEPFPERSSPNDITEDDETILRTLMDKWKSLERAGTLRMRHLDLQAIMDSINELTNIVRPYTLKGVAWLSNKLAYDHHIQELTRWILSDKTSQITTHMQYWRLIAEGVDDYPQLRRMVLRKAIISRFADEMFRSMLKRYGFDFLE